MKPEIKALWIDALNSGEYPQARGTLREVDRETGEPVGYCCLGVLTDLAVKAGVMEVKPRSRGNETCTYYVTAGDHTDEWGENSGLTRKVMEWSGVADPSGSLPEEVLVDQVDAYGETFTEGVTSLIGLNDSAGFNFKQIADVIEAQY